MTKNCDTCKFTSLSRYDDPCYFCNNSNNYKWKPKEETPKEFLLPCHICKFSGQDVLDEPCFACTHSDGYSKWEPQGEPIKDETPLPPIYTRDEVLELMELACLEGYSSGKKIGDIISIETSSQIILDNYDKLKTKRNDE